MKGDLCTVHAATCIVEMEQGSQQLLGVEKKLVGGMQDNANLMADNLISNSPTIINLQGRDIARNENTRITEKLIDEVIDLGDAYMTDEAGIDDDKSLRETEESTGQLRN